MVDSPISLYILSLSILYLYSTPEVHALLDQCSILGCRIVDAASSGKSKQFIHDFWECIWTGIEVWADPSTTLALAEVTAYLCHALEVEQTLPSSSSSSSSSLFVSTSSSAAASASTMTGRAEASQRRYQRNQQQRRTYLDPIMVSNDPHATVEQIIMSSLGERRGVARNTTNTNANTNTNTNTATTTTTNTNTYEDDRDRDDDRSIPSSVVLDGTSRCQPPVATTPSSVNRNSDQKDRRSSTFSDWKQQQGGKNELFTFPT